MDHTARTFASKLTYNAESPVCERIFSPRDNSSPMVNLCGSWKSKMFTKVKECKDVIKNAFAFDKTPMEFGQAVSKKSMAPTIPDIITFSVIARNSEEEEVLIDSSLSTQETERSNATTGPLDDSNREDSSFNYSLPIEDSLKSFLENERRVAEEFPEGGATTSVAKKKISAQPFLSYTEGAAEFIWHDDIEDSFASGPLNDSQTSDIVFEIPQRNSTFCESLDDSKNIGSSNVQDSGYGNQFSI
ncbi:uncharacterized protein LOC143358096 [Halictus rubicundus]|uniref:uncharacterized protein LOC143358096 n=1 Tax=Halictus rubicundus TaxID=77578 RepID=UPI00403597E5